MKAERLVIATAFVPDPLRLADILCVTMDAHGKNERRSRCCAAEVAQLSDAVRPMKDKLVQCIVGDVPENHPARLPIHYS